MSAPILERIHAIIAARLALAIPDATVVRNFEAPVDLSAAAGRRWIGIEDGREEVLENFNDSRRSAVDIPVTCLVGTDRPEEIGPALTALYGAVLNALHPLYQCEGLAEVVTYTGSEAEVVTTDTAYPMASRVCHFVVQFSTDWRDVAVLGDC